VLKIAMDDIGKIIAAVGVLLVIIGILVSVYGNIFSWFGNLPGDIRIRRESFLFFFPLTSMILVSVVVTFVWWLVRKFF